MNGETGVFDQPQAVSLAVAKAEYLRDFLPEFVRGADLRTALDVGCGFGYFSAFLRDLGLTVRAIDVRPGNIARARTRYPDIGFAVHDIEDPSVVALGDFDLVLCLGVLYHLENPFRAIRNLFSLTRKICVIETMIAPFSAPLTAFVEEGEGLDQSQSHLAQIPSESWFLKTLSKAGFPFIYRLSGAPLHPDFRSSLIRKRRRTFFVASKVSLSVGGLAPAAEPRITGRFMWYSFGIGRVLEHRGVREALKVGIRRLKHISWFRFASPRERDRLPR